MNTSSRVICYGEILWDVLPTGEVPGGAPMNVAYHLNKLGLSPLVITRIGKDERGQKLVELLESKNIPVLYVQRDKLLPTGVVHATPNELMEMKYDIVAPVAWDVIEWQEDFKVLFDAHTYFVYGSLIARNDTSRNTLFKLLEMPGTKVLDVNLRPPHYDEQLLSKLLSKANIVKMNHEELEYISSWSGNFLSDEERIDAVRKEFNVDTVVVTRGAQGALMSVGGKLYEHSGFRVTVQDTVGSGDSFLAAVIAGLIAKHDPHEVLEFACAVGALVTSKKGGWPEYELKEIENLRSSTSNRNS